MVVNAKVDADARYSAKDDDMLYALLGGRWSSNRKVLVPPLSATMMRTSFFCSAMAVVMDGYLVGHLLESASTYVCADLFVGLGDGY